MATNKFGTLIFQVILLFALNTLSAQNPNLRSGYYTRPDGERITGVLNINKWQDNLLRFQAEGSREWIKLRPADVATAGTDAGMYFLPLQMVSQGDTVKIFALRVLEGRFSLYEGRFGGKRRYFWITIPDRPAPIFLNPRGLEIQLKTLCGECPAAQKRVPDYDHPSLIYYVKSANDCAFAGQPAKEYTEHSHVRFGIGPSAFFYSIHPDVGRLLSSTQLLHGHYAPINKISGGLTARLDLSPYVGLTGGVNYIDKSMHSDTILTLLYYLREDPVHPVYDVNYYKFKMDMVFKYVEFPFGLSLNLMPYRKWNPFVSVEYAYWFPVKVKMLNEWGYPYKPPGDWHDIPSGEVGHLKLTGIYNHKSPGGMCITAGLRKKLQHKNELELKFSYFFQQEQTTLFVNVAASQTYAKRTNRLQVAFSYLFFTK